MAPQQLDDDGWPLHPSAAEGERAREREFERNMRIACERWRSGDLTAFTYAMRLCWPHRLAPRWLVDASAELVERAMAEDEKRARREWLAHRERWELTVELRERGPELLRRGDRRGTNLKSIRAAVSRALATPKASISDAAVKYSYELVEAAGGENATFESYLEESRRRAEQKRRRQEDKSG
jgi:hypothetical protein